MKLSRNMNPSQEVKSWAPEELTPVQSLSTLETPIPEQVGMLNRFLQNARQAAEVVPSGGMAGKVVKSEDADIAILSWLPSEFKEKPAARPSPKWEPAIKAINAALSPAERAEQIVRDAHQKAEEIIIHAQQTADSITREAVQAGLEDGRSQTHELVQTLQKTVDDTFSWRDQLLSQSENMVLNLIKTIAQTMFGEGLVLEPEVLQQNFNRVLENARSLGNLRIYVNPEDAAELGPVWREYQESISSQRIEIIPSGSILRGGCYVNGQWGSADGRVETQLRAVLDTLTEGDNKESK